MKTAWWSCFQGFSPKNKEFSGEFEAISKAHTEPGRYYHNLSHLGHLIGHIETHADRLHRPNLLKLVTFYHDIVYDSHSATNESDSADRARTFLTGIGFPQEEIDWVADTILRTAKHQGEGADEDQRFFLDADLSILGAEPETYRKYAADIRREYIWVPEDQYRKGRREVLQKFLARDRIYFTAHFHEKLEARARKNIQSELEILKEL